MKGKRLSQRLLDLLHDLRYVDDDKIELNVEFDLVPYIYTGHEEEIIRAPIESVRLRGGKLTFKLGKGRRKAS